MLSTKHRDRNDRRNSVYVETCYSSDGRSGDGYWLSRDPDTEEGRYALFLLIQSLTSAPCVKEVLVYDKDGKLDERYCLPIRGARR